MNRNLQLGFIGGGINSAVGRAHAIASQMDGKWELAAGAFSRDLRINSESAITFGVDQDRTYSDWRQLLVNESGRLDAVAVLTPTPQHEEQIELLLNSGFNVISEKALALSSRGARKLHECAVVNDRFLAVTYNYTGYPMVRELRGRILHGQLGRIVSLQIEMPQEGFLRRSSSGEHIQPQEWRRRDANIPTVSLDLGTHTHHLTRFLIDSEASRLVGIQSHHGAVSGVTDYVSCLARFKDDIDVNLWYGKCALGYRNGLRIRVLGEEGSAEWTQSNPEEIRMADSMGNLSVVDRGSPNTQIANEKRYERFKVGHPAGFLEAFANLYWDMAEALKNRLTGDTEVMPFVFGANHAEEGLAFLEAIALSSRESNWVEVPRLDNLN